MPPLATAEHHRRELWSGLSIRALAGGFLLHSIVARAPSSLPPPAIAVGRSEADPDRLSDAFVYGSRNWRSRCLVASRHVCLRLFASDRKIHPRVPMQDALSEQGRIPRRLPTADKPSPTNRSPATLPSDIAGSRLTAPTVRTWAAETSTPQRLNEFGQRQLVRRGDEQTVQACRAVRVWGSCARSPKQARP